MMGILKNHLIIIWVIHNNLVETQSLLPHLIKDLTAAHKVNLSIIIHSLEPISSENFLCVPDVVWKHNVPLAIGCSIHSKLCDTVQWLLSYTSIQIALISMRHVDKKSSFSSLGHPSAVIELLDCAPIMPIVLFVFKLFYVSFDLLKCFKLLSIV